MTFENETLVVTMSFFLPAQSQINTSHISASAATYGKVKIKHFTVNLFHYRSE